MANNSQSLTTYQQILDRILPFGDINPVLVNVSGYQLEPFKTICMDVLNLIYAQPFPYKWNEIKLPLVYTNSYQQDYVLLNPDGTSFYQLEWLERGIAVEMTSTQLPKAWGYVECGRQLTQATGNLTQPGLWGANPVFTANSFPNYMLYYGTWGGTDSDGTLGNNPGPGAVYISPLANNTQAANPIAQIIDTQGNIQVLTTYGTCGQNQPDWPASNAPFGTQTQDGSVVWTVADPNGIGIRILPVPSQTGVVYQLNLIGQMPAPPPFTSLSQTMAPFPDKYEPYFRQGVIAQCYRYASNPVTQAKFEKNYQLWMASLVKLRELQDRELEENRFTLERGIMGGGNSRSTWVGPAWPFNGPPN